MSGIPSAIKQANDPSFISKGGGVEEEGGKKSSSASEAGCGCSSTGKCSCPPNQCTCPNCPREQDKQKGMEKQIETKPGEGSEETRKMPKSSGLDTGKLSSVGGTLDAICHFPSESDRSAVDSSLRGPLNSLLEIRDCLLNKLKQGNFNEEIAKSCSDHLDHWEGKYRSKEGIYSSSGAGFSSGANQIPKGQEVIGQVIQQIRYLQGVLSQHLKESGTKEAASSPIIGGLKQKSEAGEIGAKEGGTGMKKPAQSDTM